jgi:hypothetical protein
MSKARKVAVGVIEGQETAEAAWRRDQALHLVKRESLQCFHRRGAGKKHRPPTRQHVKDMSEAAAGAEPIVAEKTRILREEISENVIVAREASELVVVRESDRLGLAG